MIVVETYILRSSSSSIGSGPSSVVRSSLAMKRDFIVSKWDSAASMLGKER